MESTPLVPARPALPVAPYLGGKRNLSRVVIERLRLIPHATYAEPFVGMGGVFLRRPFRAASEVINDISRDVTTLFRVLQRHYVAFLDMLRWQITSRAEFERLSIENPDSLTDLERSARFLYLQRTAFGGKIEGRNFGVTFDGRAARFDITKLGTLLEAVHERLAGVVIERLPWDAFLTRYDRPTTLFYLDPPYFGSEDDYGPGVFSREDFTALAKQLRGLKGSFVLSLNDRPEVRKIFTGFALEPVDVAYTLSASGSRRAAELIITKRTSGGS